MACGSNGWDRVNTQPFGSNYLLHREMFMRIGGAHMHYTKNPGMVLTIPKSDIPRALKVLLKVIFVVKNSL